MSRITERLATKTRESANDLCELIQNTLDEQVIAHVGVAVVGDDVVITGSTGATLPVTVQTRLDIDHRLVTTYTYLGGETTSAHDIALRVLNTLR